jgi:CDP-glucose 4,6-dehydratase
LCEWLLELGARVSGYSLPPPTSPALFDQLGLGERLESQLGDVRDLAALHMSMREAEPAFIFHLAAQPLVRLSYREPVETYATNLMGTVHLLDAVRRLGLRCVVICVTTDKCYENREWPYGYREEDPLGGYDPYSSSKAAAEIAIAAYRRSFFATGEPISVASVRAGNVIGGGDWALDRIVPDCVRSLEAGTRIGVRNPHSTRPWQHVLEPLGGYLTLAASIAAARAVGDSKTLGRLCSAFNFGPGLAANREVGALVTEVLRHAEGSWVDHSDPVAVHEAGRLNLTTDKAFHQLGWYPVWGFERTVAETMLWYRRPLERSAVDLTREQIARYLNDAEARATPLNP